MICPVIDSFFESSDKTIIAMDTILILSLIFSMLFWLNPLRNGTRHKFDSVFSKLSTLLFSLYLLFYKESDQLDKTIYILALTMSITLFNLSSSCSNHKWCSHNHVLVHAFFHIIIILTLAEYLRPPNEETIFYLAVSLAHRLL